MTIDRSELENYLNDFLYVSDFQDYAPNGLQVEGKKEIQRIVTGVTACQKLIDKAVELHADAILVHHGYFWKGEDPRIIGPKYHRIKSLLSHDINLFGYHLPLDAHSKLGNNVLLGKQLGFDSLNMLDNPLGKGLLYAGETSIDSGELLAEHIESVLQRKPLHIAVDRSIKRVAWCTGGAPDLLTVAAQAGCDAYITGEVYERTVHEAREWGIHFFAAGHHATERYGIQALGQYLADTFKLDVQFVDIDNPV